MWSHNVKESVVGRLADITLACGTLSMDIGGMGRGLGVCVCFERKHARHIPVKVSMTMISAKESMHPRAQRKEGNILAHTYDFSFFSTQNIFRNDERKDSSADMKKTTNKVA